MISLIENASINYDFVIIDTPPLLLTAEALILGKMTDGILFVSRPGVVDAASVVSAKESLAQSNQNVLGLVVNGVIPANEPNSYFRHTRKYYAQADSLIQKKTSYEVKKEAYRS
jgi:Mrp family chromosome partitioning ATPase